LHDPLKISHLCVHIVWMELQVFHIAGFERDDYGALELYIMTVDELIFTFHQFVGLTKPDMLLFAPSLLSGLNNPSAHCRRDRTHPDAARALPGWQASTLDVPGQRYAIVAASGRAHRWASLPLSRAPCIAPCIIFPPSSVPSFPFTWWLFHIALFTCHN